MTVIYHDAPLAGRFEQLVAMMAPQAIQSEAQHQRTLLLVQRLMDRPKLTRGQSLYLETLVQLVQAYEAERHAIDVSDLNGVETLRYLLVEHGMSASDLARLLNVHVSMGSKILHGERSLTIEHVRKLADRFGVSAELFID